MSGPTWQEVATILVARWPAGPSNRGWEREQVAAFIAELQHDELTPGRAVAGLRAYDSDFVPTVGGVRRRATEARGPLTTEEIQKAEERIRRESRERAARMLGRDDTDVDHELAAG